MLCTKTARTKPLLEKRRRIKMDKVKKFISNLFTEVDNVTWDLTKVLAAISIIAAITLAVVAVVYKGQVFNMQDYGIGVAALFAGTGVAMGMKKDTVRDIGE
jgi:hypothetical protein